MLLERTAQLKYLEEQYAKPGARMLVVYGLRNVGKTGLLKEFAKDKKLVFLCARSCSGKEQRFLWAAECELQHVTTGDFPSYTELFSQISKSAGEKTVVVVDEFQNAVKSDPAFMKELADFLKYQGKVQELFLILGSSSVNFVENNMVSRIGEAALSISGFLKVKELRFVELQKYFSGYSLRQCLEVYGILGGFPGLWKRFDKSVSPKENIIRYILEEGSYIQREAVCYVRDELREAGVYYTLLTSLASGMQKLNDLHRHTGFGRAKISVYLKNLMERELVEKVFSCDTDGKANTQKGVYRIKNPLVLFYFRCMYPFLSSRKLLSAEKYYERFVEEELNSLAEFSMRAMCRERLEIQNNKRLLPFYFTKTGEWAGKIGNIDIVAQDDAGHTLIAFCNYKEPVLQTETYEWILFLAKKAKLTPDAVILYSAGGFDAGLSELAQEDERLKLVALGKAEGEV